MLNSVLNIAEQDELNRISGSLTLDSYTRTLAINFLAEYKQKIRAESIDRLSMMVCCAILAASKSQVLPTVKGEKVRGIGLSITQILRTLSNITSGNINSFEFLTALREFIGTVALEAEVALELKHIIERFAFSYTFYTKYKNILKQLEIKENDEYTNLLQNLGWLIFINARSHILQNRTELVEAVYLLSATFTHILVYLPDSVPIMHFQRNNLMLYNQNGKGKNEEAIITAVAELLKINYSKDDYIFHKNSLQNYIQTLFQNEILKSRDSATQSFEGMFDQSMISSNTRKLEAYYQKRLLADELDERFYIKDRKANTPGKFTPFAKQGAANKLSQYNANQQQLQGQQQQSQGGTSEVFQQPRKTFHSHRVLNYEVTENVTIRSNLSEIKFANKSIPQSPYTRLMPATPMTAALEMYNWLSEKVRKVKKVNGISSPLLDKCLSSYPSLDKESLLIRVEKLSERVLHADKDKQEHGNTAGQMNSKKLKDYHGQISSLYIRTLEEMLMQVDKKNIHEDQQELLLDSSFHRALIACCIETVFFVNNSSNVAFVALLDMCEIQAFDFWKVISGFEKSDPHMPFPIKKHLYDLEVKIITQLAWRRGSQIHQIVKMHFQESVKKDNADSIKMKDIESSAFHDSPGNSNESTRISNMSIESGQRDSSGSRLELSSAHEVFFQRVLHHAAGEIYQLSELLKIPDRISEHVWAVMKYILSSETNLLIDRHLAQLILSTVYGVCKVLNQPLKFHEIIAKYQELPSFNKNELSDVIYNVYLTDNDRGDLVRFYNVVYISYMKAYLFSSFSNKSTEMKASTPLTKKPVIPALTLASPLRDSLPQKMMNLSFANKKKSPMVKMTPNMTPMTSALFAFGETPAREVEQGSNQINSKRLINFEDGASDSATTMNSAESTNKMPKYSNPLMEKILEHKHEDNEDSSKKMPSKRNLFGSSPTNVISPGSQAQGQGASKILNFDSEPSSGPSPSAGQKPSGFPFGGQKANFSAKPTFSMQQQFQNVFPKAKGVRLNFEEQDGNGRGAVKSGVVGYNKSPTEMAEKTGPRSGGLFKKGDSLTPEFKK